MIVEATELLSAFVKEEQDKIESINMPHMPTLGKAYEEITKHGINQSFSIPKGWISLLLADSSALGKSNYPIR